MWSPLDAVKRREAKRRSTYYSRIDASAFASVLLAIFYILTGGIVPDAPLQVPVDRPKARNAISQPDALREDAIGVGVTRDGRIYFRGAPVNLDELATRITEALQGGARKKVFLAADARARNLDVELVIEQVKLTEITDVIILAENMPFATSGAN